MIGSGREDGGLYLMDMSAPSVPQAHQSSGSSVSNERLMRWHNRLGHPSFQMLRRLLPGLSESASNFKLKC